MWAWFVLFVSHVAIWCVAIAMHVASTHPSSTPFGPRLVVVRSCTPMGADGFLHGLAKAAGGHGEPLTQPYVEADYATADAILQPVGQQNVKRKQRKASRCVRF